MTDNKKIEFWALEGQSFEATTYRGYGKLCDLAAISAPDTYDEEKRPEGIQRDLNTRHAKAAYEYAATGKGKLGKYRLWPEVILNARDDSVVKVEKAKEFNGHPVVKLVFDLGKIDKSRIEPQVSRVDGNHRLWFAENGFDKEVNSPIEVITPFCITIGLPLLEEQALFKDINDNQKGMNTSHLDNIIYRLMPEMTTVKEEPALWIATQMHEDPKSPFHGLVYRGGIKSQGTQRLINLRSLKNGVGLLLSESRELKAMPPGPDAITVRAQYNLIRQYWEAVKTVFSDDWDRKSLLLKGVGYSALSIVGGYVIDRHIKEGLSMVDLVERIRKAEFPSGEELSWDTDGPLSSYGGMKGVKELAETLKAEISGIDPSYVQRLAGA